MSTGASRRAANILLCNNKKKLLPQRILRRKGELTGLKKHIYRKRSLKNNDNRTDSSERSTLGWWEQRLRISFRDIDKKVNKKDIVLKCIINPSHRNLGISPSQIVHLIKRFSSWKWFLRSFSVNRRRANGLHNHLYNIPNPIDECLNKKT